LARIWDAYLPERDRKIMTAAGYRNRMGFGERPALVVIDVTINFTGDRREPVEEAIKRWPNACGEAAWDALPKIRSLVDCAHRNGLPVFFLTDDFRADGWNMGSWRWKVGRTSDEAHTARAMNVNGSDIHPDLGVAAQDIVLRKLKPSAFHGTPLRALLTLLKADTVIACGTSTSGCVRATVIDAFSDNYRVVVAEDGCFDRVSVSNAINLFDMDSKYADVLSAAEIVQHLDAAGPVTFDLPSGA
jgi:nicotinamidase-related amidase